MFPEKSVIGAPLIVAVLLVMAGCLGATGQGVGSSPTTTTRLQTTQPSSNATNMSGHYFHHSISPSDAQLTQAIDIALQNETVAATIEDSRHAVVDAWLVDRAKYRDCSAESDCAAVTINYDWGALRVFVDLETNEVWTITQITTPQKPAATLSRETAKQIALDRLRQQRSGNLTAFLKGQVGGPEMPICEYHGCFAVVVRGAGNYTALVAVDMVERKIVRVETVEKA